MKWLGHLVRMPPGPHPGEAFRALSLQKEAPGKTQDAGETISLSWPGNTSGSPRKRWKKQQGRGKPGLPWLGCCPRNATPDKRGKMDGWLIQFHFSEEWHRKLFLPNDIRQSFIYAHILEYHKQDIRFGKEIIVVAIVIKGRIRKAIPSQLFLNCAYPFSAFCYCSFIFLETVTIIKFKINNFKWHG